MCFRLFVTAMGQFLNCTAVIHDALRVIGLKFNVRRSLLFITYKHNRMLLLLFEHFINHKLLRL